MLVWGLVFAGIFWSSIAGGAARRSGQSMAYGIWLGMAILFCIVNIFLSIYMSIPGRAKPVLDWIGGRVYRSEGRVSSAECQPARKRGPIWFLVPFLFGACVLAQVVFGAAIPPRYQQPVSALYVLPFMLYILLSGQSASVLATVVWPSLYAVHAALLLAGAPILFAAKWDALNMALPTFGYGVLSFLVSHLYSRFALRRLRRAE
jgi:hypothetical protein